MKYPQDINIGDKRYKIKIVRYLERFLFLRNNIAANINYKTGVIKTVIFNDSKEDEANFFHEIAHGMLREMEFNHPKIITFRKNEKFIEEFALVLRKTIIDLNNKGVFDNTN